MNKHQLLALFALITFGSLLVFWAMLIKSYDWQITLAGLFTLLILAFTVWIIKKKLRFSNLLKKYGDEELANKIMQRTLWQGQTAGQVIDALGKPKDIDQKVLKTKTKEIWKYFPSGSRRYGLRITLDNDEVVSWDEKM